jgi:hypothetical protein
MDKRGRRRLREQRARAAAAATTSTPWESTPRDGTAGLEELARLVRRQAAIEQRIDGVIENLVAAGIGWARIGAVLGVSRQAARQRYLRRHPQRL